MSIRVLSQPHETPAWLQVQASGLDVEAAHVPQLNVRVCSPAATTALAVGSSELSKMPPTFSAANPASLSMQIFALATMTAKACDQSLRPDGPHRGCVRDQEHQQALASHPDHRSADVTGHVNPNQARARCEEGHGFRQGARRQEPPPLIRPSHDLVVGPSGARRACQKVPAGGRG